MGPELSFSYDNDIRPIAGRCSACGEKMPSPPTDPRDNVDTILWLCHHFIVHKSFKHPASADVPADGQDSVTQ